MKLRFFVIVCINEMSLTKNDMSLTPKMFGML